MESLLNEQRPASSSLIDFCHSLCRHSHGRPTTCLEIPAYFYLYVAIPWCTLRRACRSASAEDALICLRYFQPLFWNTNKNRYVTLTHDVIMQYHSLPSDWRPLIHQALFAKLTPSSSLAVPADSVVENTFLDLKQHDLAHNKFDSDHIQSAISHLTSRRVIRELHYQLTNCERLEPSPCHFPASETRYNQIKYMSSQLLKTMRNELSKITPNSRPIELVGLFGGPPFRLDTNPFVYFDAEIDKLIQRNARAFFVDKYNILNRWNQFKLDGDVLVKKN